MTNAIYRNVKAGKTTLDDGRDALHAILGVEIRYHDDLKLHAEATVIARRLNSGAAYDAHYLALAARLGIPFYTADARLYGPDRDVFPGIQLLPIE